MNDIDEILWPERHEIHAARRVLEDLGRAVKQRRALISPAEPSAHKKTVGIGIRETASIIGIPHGVLGMIEGGQYAPSDDQYRKLDGWLSEQLPSPDQVGE